LILAKRSRKVCFGEDPWVILYSESTPPRCPAGRGGTKQAERAAAAARSARRLRRAGAPADVMGRGPTSVSALLLSLAQFTRVGQGVQVQQHYRVLLPFQFFSLFFRPFFAKGFDTDFFSGKKRLILIFIQFFFKNLYRVILA